MPFRSDLLHFIGLPFDLDHFVTNQALQQSKLGNEGFCCVPLMGDSGLAAAISGRGQDWAICATVALLKNDAHMHFSESRASLSPGEAFIYLAIPIPNQAKTPCRHWRAGSCMA